MQDLLFEIGVEELPSGYIEPALGQLGDGLRRRLRECRLDAEEIKTAATPRRLTVWVGGVPEKQNATVEEVVGPPAHAAYGKDGRPTPAANGFARAQGVPLEQLKVRETPKGPYVVASVEHEGRDALELLPGILADLVREISFPKSMRWPLPGADAGDGRQLSFARPIRRLTALFGSETVPLSLAGIRAGRVIAGHPFLCPEEITLEDASFGDYCDKLEAAFVIIGTERRCDMIRRAAAELETAGEKVDMPETLLAEVAGLVEYPCALAGEFDPEFLSAPDCVLVAAMTGHQRYFPVRDPGGRLLNRFVVVSNRTHQQADTVRAGNERVLGARLADARFFWDEDRKIPLKERVESLKDVVYLGGLGNNLHRTRRLEVLADRIAEAMGLDDECRAHVREAASICKADLPTGLVGEFPSLQGLVGRELALHEQRPAPVACAVGEHYMPASADGALPDSGAGVALSLADKADAVVCCYALGYTADGSQDPYAMRRNAIGILKIIEGKGLDIALDVLLELAGDTLRSQADELGREGLDIELDAALGFFRDRLYHEALDRGYRHDMTRAVLSVGFDRAAEDARLNSNVRLFWKRLEGLVECARAPWWADLVEVVDRTYRIQKDIGEGGSEPVDAWIAGAESILEEEAEKALLVLLNRHGEDIRTIFREGDYRRAAERYCEVFAAPVHRFFDEVFVNVDDEALRLRRKELCGYIDRLFAGYLADLYLIESAGENQTSGPA